MYRITKMSGQLYALKIQSIHYDEENIMQFVKEGDVVLLCDELEDLETLGIEFEDIKIVE